MPPESGTEGGLSVQSVQRILANNANLVRDAVLLADGQRASADIRLVSSTRQGGGRLDLTGPYSGAADTLIEAEILEGSGAELRPSAPVLAGVGSGTLEVLSLDVAAVPETLTVRMVSAGTPPVPAELPFYGATLRALAEGAAGNALTLTVERRLTLTETQWSTLVEIPAGTASHEGSQWDWGAVPASGAQIPTTAPRLTFAGSAQVHRHWRTWEDGRWVYHLDPAPAVTVAAGTRVLAIEGDYGLTLTDGVTVETLAAVTVYEALAQWRARSALIEVVGTVAEDRAPGGMAVTDIPLRTDAYALSVSAEISGPYGAKRLDAMTVEVDAPTEIITIERQASGTWSVNGAVSGALPPAKTAVPYTAAEAPLGFTIPAAAVPPGYESGIDAVATLATRSEGEITPPVCLYPQLGPAATAKSVTFVYTLRPRTGECACASLPVPRISQRCLGWTEGEDALDLPAEVASRVAAVYSWREGFIRANTRWVPHAGAYSYQEGGSPGSPGQYRVRVSATFNWAGTSTSGSATYSGYLTSTFTSHDLADERASALSGAGGTAWELLNAVVGGYAVYWTRADAWGGTVDPFSWAASVETLVAEVAPIEGTTVEVPEVLAHWEGATEEIRVMDAVLDILLPCLGEVYATPAALDAWDTLWNEASAEIDARLRATAGSEIGSETNGDWYRRYGAACDNLRILAGIYPNFDVAVASACWTDDPAAAYWWVDESGEYLPVFTGVGYASARRSGGAVIPTHEFGVSVVVACEGALKVGDKITVRISGANADGYDVGDRYLVSLVAAAPAPWGGGADGDATQTWTVQGSTSGAMPDWSWDPADPADYTAGLVGLRLAQGGILYMVGDTWSLTLEGGVLRWRRDGGAWTPADLYGEAIDLGDGLTLSALSGVAPSFVAGDAWGWQALASFGPGRLRQPRAGQAWSWDGEDAVLDSDLGSVQPIGAVLLALHSLPSGASITISGGALAADEWTLEPAWSAGPILALCDPQLSARYLRLTLADCGAGASIGWLWAGQPWAPTAGVSSLTHVRQYGLTRGSGLNPSALYRGRGTGGAWAWSLDAGAALLPADVTGLLALLDHVAEQGLEWVCLVPDARTPSTAALAQIDVDAVTLTEQLGYTLDGQPLMAAELPFRAVLV